MAASGRSRHVKLVKKLNKHAQKLLKQENLHLSEEPTSIVCVCNGGLSNGVSQEEIFQLFRPYGNDPEVLMLPQKSYCFVCFSSKTDAEKSYIDLNGQTIPPTQQRQTDVILYMFYVREAPCFVSPSNDKPAGLILLEDFITQEYAEQIMDSICWGDSKEPAQTQELKHRKVKHYGYEFKYSINNVDPDEPLAEGIPDIYKPMLEKLIQTGHVNHYPDQLTINQYQPGQGIPPHIDTPSAFEDGLVSLSLGSQVLMEFRHADGRHLSVLLPERSVLIMTSESRYSWSHGITPRKSDIVPSSGGGLTLAQRGVRTSFTFRKITGVKPEYLSLNPALPQTDEMAAELENLHVHKVYEEIADHFSGTRHTPWPRIAEFLKKWPPGSLLADFGCGNGKYFGINRTIFEIGSDRSFNLAKICQERNFQVFVGDVLSIPLRSDVFDVCLCIAVIHHLSTKERRVKALSELLKILRPGGQALVYVWALEQELNKVKSKYLKKHCESENNMDQICLDKQPSKTSKFDSDCVESKVSDMVESVHHEHKVTAYHEHEVTDKFESVHIEDKVKDKLDIDNHGNKASDMLERNCTENKDSGKLGSVCLEDRTSSSDKGSNNTSSDKKVLQICDKTDDLSKTCETKDDISVTCDATVGACLGTHNSESHDKVSHDQELPGQGKSSMLSTSSAKLEVHVNRTKFKQQDVLVPWQLKSMGSQTSNNNTFHRFYHVFQKGEIEALCEGIDNCRVVASYYDQGNWAVILEKC